MPSVLSSSHSGLVTSVLKQIHQATDLESAFRFASWLAHYLYLNPGVAYHRCDELELGVLRHLRPYRVVGLVHDAALHEVHVATQVLRVGGHTALMRSLVNKCSNPLAPHVLITEMSSQVDAAEILGLPGTSVNTVDPSMSTSERIGWLAERLARFKTVFLHIHPTDLVSAVSVLVAQQLRPGLRVTFVNHADHLFSVGYAAASVVWEISAHGWALRALRGSERYSSFIGIPIERQPLSATRGGDPASICSRYVLTGGARYKYRPLHGRSLPPYLSALMSADRSLDLYVVGPGSSDWWWWALRLRFGRRVRIMKLVPKEKYVELLAGCALYVDSYPLLGGTAFPEALMSGIRVVGLRSDISGYSPADDLRVGDVRSFVRRCTALLLGDPAALEALAVTRAQCVNYHDPDQVRRRIDNTLAGHGLQAPSLTGQDAGSDSSRRGGYGETLPSRKSLMLSRAQRFLVWRIYSHAFGGWRLNSLRLLWYAYF